MNKVLVINNGSTSFRFKLFDTKNYNVLASGSIENMLKDNSYFKYTNGSDNIKKSIKINNFDEIISLMEELLIGEKLGVIDSKKEIDSIGYRVVHGGEKFNKSIIIDNKSLNEIKELCELMPLHGSKIVNSIEICSNVFPNSVPVAVFDTAFHSTIPKEIYLYAIPIEYYEKYGIRKYGFHGISYNYVFNRYLNITNTKKESYDGVICHLGGGSSLCAIKDGKSYDTTMEFTPSSGMIMASRVGNIDPIALFYIMQKENKSIEEIIDMMNK